MKLTLRHIVDLLGDFAEPMGGTYRGTPEPRDLGMFVGWAMSIVARECSPFESGVVFSPVANQATYHLDDLRYFGRRIIRPDQVVFAGNRLEGPGLKPYGVFNHSQAVEIHPHYESATSIGHGKIAVHSGNNRLSIYPKPTSEDVAKGESFVDGIVVPGWILSSGEYFPGSAPIGSDYGIGGGSSSTPGTDTNAAGTVATMGTTWTNPNNVKVDDSSVAAFSTDLVSSPDIMATLDPSRTTGSAPGIILSNFGFAAPAGASSIVVNIESLQAGSVTTDLRLTCAIVEDVTVSTLNVLGTFTVDVTEGAGTVEVGPLATLAGVSRAQLNSVNFGVVIFMEWVFPSMAPIPFDFDAEIEFVSLKASWVVPTAGPTTKEFAGAEGGTSLATTDWDAVPDLPESIGMHQALAILAAYAASFGYRNSEMAIRAVGDSYPEVIDAMDEYRSMNARPNMTPIRATNPFNRII